MQAAGLRRRRLTGPRHLLGRLCQSCLQQRPVSEFMAELNAGDETVCDVSYTQVTTRSDEIVAITLDASPARALPGPTSRVAASR